MELIIISLLIPILLLFWLNHEKAKQIGELKNQLFDYEYRDYMVQCEFGKRLPCEDEEWADYIE